MVEDEIFKARGRGWSADLQYPEPNLLGHKILSGVMMASSS